ncbi:nuclear cap-binding protein subunit 2 [[Candida] jaroonii]|uniref:Nuclear cap-binding protein subunit 2 n=1 Tax=[Candida] jaroonii TaxID=467808 RepID=A0ACA9YA45_9ASCO|nr:nuclear cap-binding protein subunit 2 [[Candida] jaroonii]
MELLEENYDHSVERLDRPSSYLIKKAVRRQNFENLEKSLHSKTVYVGNLTNLITEEQLYELFIKCGKIEKIIMGLDRNKLIPCGFCFVIYKEEQGSLNAIKYLKGTILDGQNLEIDLDPGFVEGRQFGRGVYGGQASQEGGNGFKGGYRGRGGFRGRGNGFRGRGRGRGGYNGGFRGRGGFSNGPRDFES